MDEKGNDKIKYTEKRITYGTNDEFKEMINDESADKKLVTLTKICVRYESQDWQTGEINYFSWAWN